MAISLERILDRDEELTAFQHYALEHPKDSILHIIDTFDFQVINALKYRDELIKIGHAARYYPHRVPAKK